MGRNTQHQSNPHKIEQKNLKTFILHQNKSGIKILSNPSEQLLDTVYAMV